nr:hypothetical protein [Tanacetum cinerariifolium]
MNLHDMLYFSYPCFTCSAVFVITYIIEGRYRGGDEDQGDNGDAGGEDIASSLTTFESDQAGIGTRAGIEILAVIRYTGCGGGVAADLSVSNGSVSSADGAWSAAVE